MDFPKEFGREAMEESLYTNLLLCGFRQTKTSIGLNNVELSPGMFRALNVKGLEMVLHFLLSVIFPEASKKAFQTVVPCYDSKQSKEFLVAAMDLISKLADANRLPRNICRKSTLQTASGERLVDLLWHLSAVALTTHLKRLRATQQARREGGQAGGPPANPLESEVHTEDAANEQMWGAAPVTPLALTTPASQDPKITAVIQQTQMRVLRGQIAVARRMFLTRATVGERAQAGWQQAAQAIVIQYRELSKVLSELKREQARLQSSSIPFPGETQGSLSEQQQDQQEAQRQVRDQHRQAQLEDMRSQWGSLLRHCERMDQHVPDVTSVCGDRQPSIQAEPLLAAASSRNTVSSLTTPSFGPINSIVAPTANTTNVNTATTNTVAASTTGNVDLALMVRQWTRGLQRCRGLLEEIGGGSSSTPGAQDLDDENAAVACQWWVSHAESLAAQAERHRSNLTQLRVLVATVGERTKDTVESIRNLREKVHANQEGGHTLPTDDNNPVLDLLSPTPAPRPAPSSTTPSSLPSSARRLLYPQLSETHSHSHLPPSSEIQNINPNASTSNPSLSTPNSALHPSSSHPSAATTSYSSQPLNRSLDYAFDSLMSSGLEPPGSSFQSSDNNHGTVGRTPSPTQSSPLIQPSKQRTGVSNQRQSEGVPASPALFFGTGGAEDEDNSLLIQGRLSEADEAFLVH